MDKTWMDRPRSSTEYQTGLQSFLDFAFSNSNNGTILCPCRKCKNGICRTRSVVLEHLLWNGFLNGYTKWVLHGELLNDEVHAFQNYIDINASNNMQEMLHDAFRMEDAFNDFESVPREDEGERPCKEAEKFYRLMQDAEKELYPGCQKFSRLSFIVRLLQIKCLGNRSRDIGPDDIFSQVVGQEKGGRVKLYGKGVTASDVYGDIPRRGKYSFMNMTYKNEVEALKKRADQQDKLIMEQSRQIQELIKMNKQRLGQYSPPEVNRVPSSSSHDNSTSRRPSASSSSLMPLRVGAKVSLRSMLDSSKIVAIGYLESIDPSKQVGQVRLGKNWCEVHINVGVELDEELLRPISHFKTIGDAVGLAVAWPQHLVTMDI